MKNALPIVVAAVAWMLLLLVQPAAAAPPGPSYEVHFTAGWPPCDWIGVETHVPPSSVPPHYFLDLNCLLSPPVHLP